jgi:hypothetical protein
MSDQVDFNSSESWTTARAYARQLAPFPDPITAAVSTLWRNFQKNIEEGTSEIRADSLNAVRRLDKSTKLKTPLYFAATDLFPERVNSLKEDDTTQAILKILEPGLFAALLTAVYFHKRLAKLCAPNEWAIFSKEFVLNVELGYLAGFMVPNLGGATGALLCALRYGALGIFLSRDADQFSRYRNKNKKRFNLEDEHERWGCDHGQIAAFFMQSLGIRRTMSETAQVYRHRGPPSAELPEDLQKWNGLIQWIDAIRDGLPGPEFGDHAAALGLSPIQTAQIKASTDALFKKGSSFAWMLKKMKDEGAPAAPA